jgi:hypothetical protein
MIVCPNSHTRHHYFPTIAAVISWPLHHILLRSLYLDPELPLQLFGYWHLEAELTGESQGSLRILSWLSYHFYQALFVYHIRGHHFVLLLSATYFLIMWCGQVLQFARLGYLLEA